MTTRPSVRWGCRVRWMRCLLVWVGVSAATLGGAAWLLPVVPRRPASTDFPDLVLGVAGLALAGCLVWAWLVTTIVVLERLAAVRDLARAAGPVGARWRAPRLLTPRWARRLVVVACGLALVGTAPAHASVGTQGSATSVTASVPARGPAELAAQHAHEQTARLQRAWEQAHGDPVAPLPLGGLPLPDRADGPGSRPRALGRAVAEVVVRRGDDLWSIAADALGPRAGTAEIARATAALYAVNRAVVGADPDLVVPGQHLRLPLPVADRREEHP